VNGQTRAGAYNCERERKNGRKKARLARRGDGYKWVDTKAQKEKSSHFVTLGLYVYDMQIGTKCVSLKLFQCLIIYLFVYLSLNFEYLYGS
jgi:hypothetical protein